MNTLISVGRRAGTKGAPRLTIKDVMLQEGPMIGENRPSRWVVFLLWGLAVVPSLIGVLTEINKTHLVWYVRVVDFCDLAVTAPFYLAALLALHGLVVSHERRCAYWLGLVLIGILMYGHAMHLTANAVNTYSTEIRDYASIIPPDSYALLYFFDEDLGHWLFFGAYFALLGLWLWEDRFVGIAQIQTVLPGILLGVALAIAVVESSHPWIGVVASVLLIGLALLRSLREHGMLAKLWKDRPVGRFVLAGASAIIVTELLYLLIVGDFTQPTDLDCPFAGISSVIAN